MVLFKPATLSELSSIKAVLTRHRQCVKDAALALKDFRKEKWDEANDVQSDIDSMKGQREYYDEVGYKIQEKKDLIQEIRDFEVETRDRINDLSKAAQDVLRLNGVYTRLVFIRDKNETDSTAAINFYGEDGTSIFEAADFDGFESLVITSHLIGYPLTTFRQDTARFDVRFETQTYVTFVEIDGENSIVLWYTSGNYFIVRNHIGLTNMSFFEYVWTAAGFVQS